VLSATRPLASRSEFGSADAWVWPLTSSSAFRFSKKYFWFGEEAAVPTSSLSHYLRGEKAEVAHPTAAWSSVTGKGLLYFVKHADEKPTPAGALKLVCITTSIYRQ
jgi:hypothetical protein